MTTAPPTNDRRLALRLLSPAQSRPVGSWRKRRSRQGDRWSSWGRLVGQHRTPTYDSRPSPYPCSALNSHARAKSHSRCTVRGAIPRTVAVSSAVSPPK